MTDIPYVKPAALNRGDTIGIVAPASCGQADGLTASCLWLEQTGFRIKTGRSCTSQNGYLAGTDDLRANDMNDMFRDDSVKAVLCLRGGYGSMRILSKIDYSAITSHPKIFIGYSDVTALHTAINQRCHLITFHGPMAASNMATGLDTYTANSLQQAIIAPTAAWQLCNPPGQPPPQALVKGHAAGRLTGGNLSVIAATLGTPYEINTTGKLLCLEDVGEAPYRIDRLLTQLELAGKLQAAAGLIFGSFTGCEPEAATPDFTIDEIITAKTTRLGIPVITGLSFGHIMPQLTLPLGVKAAITAGEDSVAIVLQETATS